MACRGPWWTAGCLQLCGQDLEAKSALADATTRGNPVPVSRSGFVFACFVSALLPLGAGVHAEIFHAQGEMAGEPTRTGVLLQSRLTRIEGPYLDADQDVPGAEGTACFEYGTDPALAGARRTPWMQALPERDYILRARLEGLQSGTRYYYRLVFGESQAQLKNGPLRQFQTLSPVNSDSSVSFLMGSCQNYAFFMNGKGGDGAGAAPEADRNAGYPAYAAMLALEPDFFIGTGDIVYYDHPAKTAARTLPELRRKWHEQFRLPRLIEFFGRTPAYWSKDDHDFRFNDADLGGERLPQPAAGIAMFREQMPIHPAGDGSTPTYRSHRVHRHLQLWLLEGRDYRSSNRMPDGPQKSMWGAEQRAWLEESLRKSDASWKVIVSPTPMVGPDSNRKVDNHSNPNGFRHEADTFFAALKKDALSNVMVFCGDRHWQYHSIHPLGFEEFSCGALNTENAIAGVRPGTPGSTDPDGRIQQPFLYSKPVGGFLRVRVGGGERGRLEIAFHNDRGEAVYAVEKNVPAK
jgi:alkaline phosphatase D